MQAMTGHILTSRRSSGSPSRERCPQRPYGAQGCEKNHRPPAWSVVELLHRIGSDHEQARDHDEPVAAGRTLPWRFGSRGRMSVAVASAVIVGHVFSRFSPLPIQDVPVVDPIRVGFGGSCCRPSSCTARRKLPGMSGTARLGALALVPRVCPLFGFSLIVRVGDASIPNWERKGFSIP